MTQWRCSLGIKCGLAPPSPTSSTSSLPHHLLSICSRASRAATARWSVGVKRSTNLGRLKGESARTQLSLNTRTRSPGITALLSTHILHHHHRPSPVPPFPLQPVISICEDRHSSRMQMRPSAGMHIYSSAETGAKLMGRVWGVTPVWCSIFTLTQRHRDVNTTV